MALPHRPVGGCSPNRVAALALLDQYPAGKHSRDMAVILDMTPGRAAKLMQNLAAAGLVKTIAEGTKQHARRVRYYLPQHTKAAIAAHNATRGVEWGRSSIQPASKKQTTIAGALKPAGKTQGKPKITICPAGVDHRFTVHTPQPCFSGLPPGTYLPDDTWAAKAYPCT